MKCRNNAHIPDQCGRIIMYGTSDLKLIVRKMIEQTIDKVVIRKCPKCYTKYEKIDGCNLITCLSCHAYSCYQCDQIIEVGSGSKYKHFKGHSDASSSAQCLLYSNGTAIDPGGGKGVKEAEKQIINRKIVFALENLVQINIDNIEIATMLINMIRTMDYKIKSFDVEKKTILGRVRDDICGIFYKKPKDPQRDPPYNGVLTSADSRRIGLSAREMHDDILRRVLEML
jgi:hypothetical protein